MWEQTKRITMIGKRKSHTTIMDHTHTQPKQVNKQKHNIVLYIFTFLRAECRPSTPDFQTKLYLMP